MPLFESRVQRFRQLLADVFPSQKIFFETAAPRWPKSANRQMILEQDMGAELGHGRLGSFACILWTEDTALVRDGAITLYGPDIGQMAASQTGRSLPFGKLVLLGVEAMPPEQLFAAYEEMDAVRFRQNLKGYMLRGFSQRNREWSRVSRDACGRGFSFAVLGGELIRDYRALPFVRSAEVLFFTESALVERLSLLAEECARMASALNTIFENVNMDCKNCDSTELCDEIDELRQLHKAGGRTGAT